MLTGISNFNIIKISIFNTNSDNMGRTILYNKAEHDDKVDFYINENVLRW